jgi:curved DNA-binding protein CbpA
MKLDSKYFDSIRIQPRRGRSQAEAAPQQVMACQWEGCQRRGTHRAPRGRDREGEYFYFCRAHVAAYNKSYNYFSGMSDGEISDYQKASSTGHRPTWTMGVNKQEERPFPHGAQASEIPAHDPFDILKGFRARRRGASKTEKAPRRVLHNAARKHLASLNLDEHASAPEIRAQFKALVKLHHPDHNGGDRSSEERFREVIDAYNYLKQTGLC